MCFFQCLCCSSLAPILPQCSQNLIVGKTLVFGVICYKSWLFSFKIENGSNFHYLLPYYWWGSWVSATKFLTGASAVGSIAIPVILKHAGVIGWGALAMELSSFFVFVIAIMCYIGMDNDDSYNILWDIVSSFV